MQKNSNRARLTPLLVKVGSRLNDAFDLASMAQEFGASPFHFHRLFRDSMGETPRQHVERLRLERAALRLALTYENVQDVCHAVGFGSHETFTRAFKRYFEETPSQFCRRTHAKREKYIKEGTLPIGNQCRVSNVRLETLRPGFLLAKRRVGDYSKYSYAPFTKSDRLWNSIVRWAARNKVAHEKTAWGLTYDMPGLTPPELQRFDGCIRVNRAVTGSREIQCLPFEGGSYIAIEHYGPSSTITAAYSGLVHAMNLAPNRYVYREGPALTIYRAVPVDENSFGYHTTVCFPIVPIQQRKKRQSRSGRAR